MSKFRSNKVHAWLPEPPSTELRNSVERLADIEDVRHIALMPDAHVAEQVCVGAVVATKERLYPDAVGGDIGCGMLAARFDVAADTITEPAARRFLDALRAEVPTNRQSRRQDFPEELEQARLSSPALQRVVDRDGRIQFGTLGRGNHFLELQEAADDGALWIMIHSGSRGLGPAVRAHHLERATSQGRDIRGIEVSSSEGEAYLADVRIAVSYADASRRRMLERTADVLATALGATLLAESLISCAHNFVRCERHGIEMLWVHRKGAASADVDEPAVIPGSMGADSFHVVGRGHAEALRSSSHGAGRCMSRGEARRRISLERFRDETAGIWFVDRGDALVDEAPSAYKPIRDVMRAQKELTKIVRRLKPVVVYKGV